MTTNRQRFESGFYHVTARGNGKQIIFNDNEDYEQYLIQICKFSAELSCQIVAYCLMNNHIHIILYDPDFTMNRLFQKAHSMYARYFNYKYERAGNLFQGRYKSKGIADEKQLCATIRYVLKNPEDAGICKAIDYPWSSYKLYGEKNFIINSKKIEEYFGDFSSFKKFIETKNKEGNFRPNDVDDEILKNLIYRNYGYRLSTIARGLPRRARDEIILFLYSKGATVKQIVRLTGVSYGIIYRLTTKDKKILTS